LNKKKLLFVLVASLTIVVWILLWSENRKENTISFNNDIEKNLDNYSNISSKDILIKKIETKQPSGNVRNKNGASNYIEVKSEEYRVYYQGPRGNNIPFVIVNGDKRNELSLPIGNVNLQDAKILIKDRKNNTFRLNDFLKNLKKLDKKKEIKIFISKETGKVLSISIRDRIKEYNVTTIGDLPNLNY
jgi:hypothetical protein